MASFLHTIQQWDDDLIGRIIARRRDPLTVVMKGASLMGDGYLWAFCTTVIYLFSAVTFHWLLTGILAFVFELSAYKIIKQSTTRQRPFRRNPSIRNLVVPQDEFSFPSGHTAAATVAALLFGIALPVVFPLFLFLAVLIGLSRIYLGVHYPSDVAMGFVLGVLSFSLSTALL